MSSPYLIVVKVNNEHKIAQFCQSGGILCESLYKVLQFIRTYDLNIFKNNVKTCTLISNAEVEKMFHQHNLVYNGYEPIEDEYLNRKGFFMMKYPQYDESLGTRILNLVAEDKNLVLDDNFDFGLYSRCNYCYYLDMDTEELKIYTKIDGKDEVTPWGTTKTHKGKTPVQLLCSVLFSTIKSFEINTILNPIMYLDDKHLGNGTDYTSTESINEIEDIVKKYIIANI